MSLNEPVTYKSLRDAKEDHRHESRKIRVFIFALAIMLIGYAEFAMLYDPGLGLLIHSGIILLIVAGLVLFHRLESTRRPSDSVKYTDAANLLKALTLLPLIRLLDYTLPLVMFRPVYWPVMVSVPLLLGVGILARILKIGMEDVGLVMKKIPLQILIASTGIGFGFLEYAIIRPSPLISSFDLSSVIVPATVLMVFTGLTEELVFRGILQNMAVRLFTPAGGIIFTSLLFMVMHVAQPFQDPATLQVLVQPDLIGTAIKVIDTEAPELTYVFLASVFYGIVYQRTKILTGIIVSHGLTNIVLLLVAPFVAL